ncbi:MAG: serine/threonine-protein kinase, partial [Planctomycetota bacterium]
MTEPMPDPGSDNELLRRWEERIAAEGDPLGALADVLGGRREQRVELFRQVGRTMRGCRLESILGAGGIGVTYLAKTAEGAACAVKLVSGVGDAAGERFAQECRLLQSLDHPAIVRYRDHAVLPDGTGVLVMDFVDGVDLDRLLADVPIADASVPPWSELLREVESTGDERLRSPRYRRRVLRLLAVVADGLQAAHERGIVHRDVKPANILVRPDLSPVLIDFGLARDQQVRVSFTASGAAMGTLAYMAPEQLGRDPGAVDARTDVYALGLVLYRALLGVERRTEVAAVVRASRRPFLLDAKESQTLPVELQAIL